MYCNSKVKLLYRKLYIYILEMYIIIQYMKM